MAKTAAVSPDYDGYKDGSVEPGYCGLPGYRLHETISTPTRDVGVFKHRDGGIAHTISYKGDEAYKSKYPRCFKTTEQRGNIS